MELGLILLIVVNFYLSNASLNLPLKHLSIYYNQQAVDQSLANKQNLPKCYGFESKCSGSEKYEPTFPHSCSGRELSQFWAQGDFGYVSANINNRFPICEGGSSAIYCTRWLQFCQARYLFLNLTHTQPRRGPRHVADVFNDGEIGGECHVDNNAIKRESLEGLNGNLWSWFSELKVLTRIENQSKLCDVVIDKPVVFMKWDEGDNMYHRINDFLNLYISLLVNGSIKFDDDMYIVSWNWTTKHYKDYFSESLNVFTKHPIIDLKSWFGKKICIRSALFSFLPRMVLGLYYNTRLGKDCWGSGLVKSFSDFYLHRMKIDQDKRSNNITRVTFLSRKQYHDNSKVMYRQILNQDELIQTLSNITHIKLKVVDFRPDKISFRDQLKIIGNTDILISIHGAGLTHLLFLPDWAVVFEIFDCEANCYRDLARLRGIQHVTWEDQSKLKKGVDAPVQFHETNLRYNNYFFDRDEFRRLFIKAKSLLKKHDKIKHTEL